MISAQHELVCRDVEQHETKRMRPNALNTVQLLKLCSKCLGIGPHSAMRIAEHLYLSGYLSYPRTESSAYPSSFDFKETLRLLSPHHSLGAYARDLLTAGHNTGRGGTDAGDHPPITPVGASLPHHLSGDEARVYDLVASHFLASVSRDALYLVTKVTFATADSVTDVSGHEEFFTAQGKQELDPGFTSIYTHYRDQDGDVEDKVYHNLNNQTKVIYYCLFRILYLLHCLHH